MKEVNQMKKYIVLEKLQLSILLSLFAVICLWLPSEGLTKDVKSSDDDKDKKIEELQRQLAALMKETE